MSGGYRNKCAVSHYPAGHAFACNDCDPCVLGSAPELWCTVCHGDTWLDDERCKACNGTGFTPPLTSGASNHDQQ